MSTIKVTSGMEEIKLQLDGIYNSIEPLTTDINNSIDKIREAWKGIRSDTVLKDIEEIKKSTISIKDNLRKNIDFIDEAYKKYKELEAASVSQGAATVVPVPIETPVQPVVPIDTSTTETPVEMVPETPTEVPVETVPADIPTKIDTPISNVEPTYTSSKNITDMDSNGVDSRVISYQGANWNFFSIKDPMWSNMSLYRGNSKGDLPMSKNGTHPFAAINALANLGYLKGTKKDIVRDVASAFGTVTEYENVDGKTVKKTYKDGFQQFLGDKGIGTNQKFHTILKRINIPSTELGSNINNATNALENGKVVHCITQLDSNIAKSGHYLVMVGVEKNNGGQVTGYYLLDGLARSQDEYNTLKKQGEAIRVIEPGLIRIPNTPEALKESKLASFRSIDGANSQTQTVFSYEDYLNQI